MGLTIHRDERQRLLPLAACVGNAKPSLTLIEMGMKIGAYRPNHSAVEIDSRPALLG
jgi:hypothetical protein